MPVVCGLGPLTRLCFLGVQENVLDKQNLMNWDNLFWAVNVLMADITDLKDYHDRTQDFLSKWLCRYSTVAPVTRALRLATLASCLQAGCFGLESCDASDIAWRTVGSPIYARHISPVLLLTHTVMSCSYVQYWWPDRLHAAGACLQYL